MKLKFLINYLIINWFENWPRTQKVAIFDFFLYTVVRPCSVNSDIAIWHQLTCSDQIVSLPNNLSGLRKYQTKEIGAMGWKFNCVRERKCFKPMSRSMKSMRGGWFEPVDFFSERDMSKNNTHNVKFWSATSMLAGGWRLRDMVLKYLNKIDFTFQKIDSD